MTACAVRRLAGAVPLLLAVCFIIFVATRLLPGDPITIMLREHVTPEAVESARKHYGLDKPIPEQFAIYLGALARGDLGESIYRPGEPLTATLKRRLPPTIELAATAMGLATLAGLALGILSAVRRGTWIDRLGMSISVLGVSIPIFWLGLLFIMAFRLPVDGNLSPEISIDRPTGFVLLDTLIAGEGFGDALSHLLLPALTLATVPMSITARVARASMLEVLGSDYVRTARAKGVAPEAVVLRHALRNALVPLSTVVGLEFAYLLGGAVLTETVFSWPGMGTWIVEGALTHDYAVISAGTLVMATIFVGANLAVDLLYAAADPRIRLGEA